ncbi:MAG: division/cell wall cluster transcriptional repressor MraZ [Phycisphaerales bacterium]
MLFTGHSEHSIDAKGRLVLPAKYRHQWSTARDGSAWYCVPWPDGHLRLYTEATFEELAKVGDNTLTPGEDAASLESALFGFAERLEMDGTGRIMVPRRHMELTGLGTDVVIVGARNRLEVRSKAQWMAGEMDRFKALPGLIARNVKG